MTGGKSYQNSKGISLRDWLELGQAMTELTPIGPRYFRAYHTTCIGINGGTRVKANRKVFQGGYFHLDRDIPA